MKKEPEKGRQRSGIEKNQQEKKICKKKSL